MLLSDAYCLYNRARTTDLVSPDDMWEACGQLGGLRAGLAVSTVSSGITMLKLEVCSCVPRACACAARVCARVCLCARACARVGCSARAMLGRVCCAASVPCIYIYACVCPPPPPGVRLLSRVWRAVAGRQHNGESSHDGAGVAWIARCGTVAVCAHAVPPVGGAARDCAGLP